MEGIMMDEYLANEQAMITLRNNFPFKKLWSLENDDEENEMYEVNLDGFPAIHHRKDSWDKEQLIPIFNDTMLLFVISKCLAIRLSQCLN